MFWIIGTHLCIFIATVLLWFPAPTSTRGAALRTALRCILLLFLLAHMASWWWRSSQHDIPLPLVSKGLTTPAVQLELVRLEGPVTDDEVRVAQCGKIQVAFGNMVKRIRFVSDALKTMRNTNSDIILDIGKPRAFSVFLLTSSVSTVFSLVHQNPDRPSIDLCTMSVTAVECTFDDTQTKTMEENLWPVVMETTIRAVKRHAGIVGAPHDLSRKDDIFRVFYDEIRALLVEPKNERLLHHLLNPLLLWAFSPCSCSWTKEKDANDGFLSLKSHIAPREWNVENMTALTENALLVTLLSMVETASTQENNLSDADVWESMLLGTSLVLSCAAADATVKKDVEAWKGLLVSATPEWNKIVKASLAQNVIQRQYLTKSLNNLSECFKESDKAWEDLRSAKDFLIHTVRTDETRTQRLNGLRLLVQEKELVQALSSSRAGRPIK